MNYITITGQGNPGSEQFSNRIGALYGIAYPIKMNIKNTPNHTEYLDYTVFPMEGFWDFTEEGRKLYNEGHAVVDLKDHLSYKIMIRQPEWVTKDFFDDIKQQVHQKKKDDLFLDVQFETIEEGEVCQYTHIGSYDSEPASFQLMEEYCIENGYERIRKQHKEIYITDARKVAPEKLKTTIRFKVKKK